METYLMVFVTLNHIALCAKKTPKKLLKKCKRERIMKKISKLLGIK